MLEKRQIGCQNHHLDGLSFDSARCTHCLKKIAFRGIDIISMEVQLHIANGLLITTIVNLNTEATTSQVTIVEALAY